MYLKENQIENMIMNDATTFIISVNKTNFSEGK